MIDNFVTEIVNALNQPSDLEQAMELASAIEKKIRAIVNEERSGENVWIPAQPAEATVLLSQDVLDLSPEEYEAYSMSKNIAIHERRFSKTAGFTPPYIIDALLNKGLIEQIGTGRETTYRAVVAQPAPVAALPEGVTREHDWMLSELRLNCRLSDDNVVFYHTDKDNLSILTNVSDPAAAVGLRKSDVTRLRDYLNSVLEVME